MTPAIAIVGMACRYPDANSPAELWDNVLAQRSAFRKLPPERLALSDYYSADRQTPDAIYSQNAALIRDYAFNRERFHTVGSTYRSADLTHWLALEVAADALADAGFPEGNDLPKATTGVILGNTLTGEMSRAQSLRLRWPYVRRTVSAQLQRQGMAPAEQDAFLIDLERQFKAPFEPIGSESLAGNLANTIAGRICNHFDLHGGGYTVDGACSSSLLAVTQACGQLLMGDLEVALVGGVDISIDPFELVGFAKVGALTPERMLVYDQHSSGFIPGEGCGMVVLMTHELAIAQQKRIYAVIQGWGISSDGQGGITRPEVAGQKLAIHNTYRRAEWNINSVAYFEGHGTGTVVGDATELQALGESRREQSATPPEPAAIGSIKANIGHTKAAAGIAGLIKATLALHRQLLPPTSACPSPQSRLTAPEPALKVLPEGAVWPAHLPLRAGVSAMGFGGINTHIALENPTQLRRSTLSSRDQHLLASHQDAELLLFSAETIPALRSRLTTLLPWIQRLSRAELTDLAHALAADLPTPHTVRAAVVAESVPAAVAALEQLLQHLQSSDQPLRLRHLSFNARLHEPRIGLLFPGQAAPVYTDAGLWGQRFPHLQTLHQALQLPAIPDPRSTALAQPAIIASSLLGLAMLQELHIEAVAAVGHSLGELAALHWGGAFDAPTLQQLARRRGQIMQTHGAEAGAMASLEADARTVEDLCLASSAAGPVSLAGLNSPCQTVIAGEAASVMGVVERAKRQGVAATLLPVSQAFHSPLMDPVVSPFRGCLDAVAWSPLSRAVYSTVTGDLLAPDTDLQTLLTAQLTQPVHCLAALNAATPHVDLWLEVGPGHILSHLAKQAGSAPSVAIDAGSRSLAGLLEAIAAVFTLGGSVNVAPLFQDRFHRPLVLGQTLRFFQNPCEQAPEANAALTPFSTHQPLLDTPQSAEEAPSVRADEATSPLDYLRELVARRTELPLSAVAAHHRLLSDLHLNSISVGQFISEAANGLGLRAPADPTSYANATLAEVATALTDCTAQGPEAPPEPFPAGVAPWLRAFELRWQPEPLLPRSPSMPLAKGQWHVVNLAGRSLPHQLPAFLSDTCPGQGLVVVLPEERTEAATQALLHASQSALQTGALDAFVMLHSGWGMGFAKTLHLEHPQITTLVLHLPLEHPRMADWLRAEIQAASGFVEARYDTNGQRACPYLESVPLDSEQPGSSPVGALTASDGLLVSGGGKGIASECALAIAQQTGCQLVLLGRSDPLHDKELADNLQRFQRLGIEAHYFVCDVGDQRQVQHTIQVITATLKPIAAILHGAGLNHPRLIPQLTPVDFEQTFRPKVSGLINILAAIPGDQLKQLLTFGSIIARTGLPGEADYALANEALAEILHQFQERHPHCHCLNLEWSVWSGVGMGERLGRIDTLAQQGIQPITPDQGVRLLTQLLGRQLPSPSLVLTSRFGALPTLRQATPELPLLRFLERPRVFYPGIELVVDVDLSMATDPYLRDHVYNGEMIFPGVMGLEAMAQVAVALAGNPHFRAIDAVQFHRPIVVPPTDLLTIRIAAISRSANEIDVVIRTAQTSFAVEHFQATFHFGPAAKPEAVPQLAHQRPPDLEIDTHLYGELLFHQGRFRRIQSMEHLTAKSCVAEIQTDPQTPWFSDYLPQSLLLGDPGARDGAIHALQACVPHATLLPMGIQQITIYQVDDRSPHRLTAIEQHHLGNQFTYDLWVTSASGALLERWHGLTLSVIQSKSPQASWSPQLLAPYLERCLTDAHPRMELAIALGQHPANDRRQTSDQLLHQITGRLGPLTRRVDGKPDPIHHQSVSASHSEDLTMVVAQPSPVVSPGCPLLACDLELVNSCQGRPWLDMLGEDGMSLARLIAQDNAESIDDAATRVWCAQECLKKAGLSPRGNLSLHRVGNPLIWLRADAALSVVDKSPLNIATWKFKVHEKNAPLVIAILTALPAASSVTHFSSHPSLLVSPESVHP